MKKSILLLSLCLFGFFLAEAQLPNGTIAPDWTAPDINGNTWNLYTQLNNGKTVYLDMFATWCGPCWNYHNTHAFKTVYETYGPPGTNEAMCFGIEGDDATNTPCLYGPSGCVGGTQGNWVSGTPYPYIDDAENIFNMYSCTYYPTIYMVCPDSKKCYLVGQLPAASLWAQRASKCLPTPPTVNVANTSNVKCYQTNSGNITLNVTGGSPPYTYAWSSGQSSQNLVGIPEGSYTCTITGSNNGSTVVGPIDIQGPGSAMSSAVSAYTNPGCNGIAGSITVDATGGWNDFTYLWSFGGQTTPTISNINAGTYTCTVTDAGGCSQVLSQTLVAPVIPVASIYQPQSISCTQPTISIDATGSSQGFDYEYSWIATNGGNIVSGENSLNPVVDASGTYVLTVINTSNNCTAYATTNVTSNVNLPTANAGPAQGLTCAQNTAVLQGTGSSGTNITYLWTASNGGNIVSGAGSLTPTVNATGTYTLVVTNTTNGCTKESVTTVTGNAVPPMLSCIGGGMTCAVTSVALTATTNATNPTFAWTGPNSFTSALQNPVVSTAGTYTAIVTDGSTGCTSTATAVVTLNNNAPGATATGGSLNCTNTTATLNGSSAVANAQYAWTGPAGFTATTQNITVSTPGAYNLAVMDPANGCVSTAPATVTQNITAPTAAASTPGNLNCSTSSIQLNGSSSSQGSNFTYAWTTTNGNIVSGANTATPTVNQAGQYAILVTNTDNGCTATANTSVAQSSPVVANIGGQSNASCHGATNGSASALATGGSGTYSYLWSNAANTAAVTGLAAGTYQVVITDTENCTSTTSVIITEPTVVAPNASATAQTANGVNDGTATANPAGGTAGYTYLWSNNESTQSISGLAPGVYTVIVTDQNGCTAQQSVNVNSYNCNISPAISGTNISCFGANNGTAIATVGGAVNPITYAWSNGAVTETVSGLAPGTYTVNVVDGNNCPATLSIIITEPTALAANATATHETAQGANNGTATATPTGGTGTYTYLWSNNEITQSISGLAPGTYTVVVTDENNCASTQSVVVNGFNCALSPTLSTTNVTCAGNQNGTATVVVTGGTAPFSYLWNNGQTEATATGLAGGDYSVVVTDANGCILNQSVTIVEPTQLLATSSNIVNVQCANDTNGEATALGSGGTGNYNYSWSNGQSTATATGLSAGVYTVEVSDANNCSIALAITIVANDDIVPAVSAQNATVSIGANGTAVVTEALLNVQSSDNCGVSSTTIAPNSFDCSELGIHTVTVTVEDGAGNITSTTAEVTVVDLTAPVVTCPSSISACPDDNIISYAAPVALDNCLSSGGQWNLTAGLPSGSEFPVGVTTQNYTYTDASGNIGHCAFDVVIFPETNISLVNITNATNNQNNGSISVNVTGGSAPFVYEWADATGTVVGTSEDLSNVGQGVYHLKVLDANGCSAFSGDFEVQSVVVANEPWWAKAMSMRPNPTQGTVYIVLPETSNDVDIFVYDMNGRLVSNLLSQNQSQIRLDLNTLPEGMYSVKVVIANEVAVKKLAVQR